MPEINNKKEIDKVYQDLSVQADKLYQFVMYYYEYINQARDYGTGQPISMVEVHTLSMIDDHPGTTVSELAQMWNRTKSAVSQNVTKLVKKGYVYRSHENDNAKTVHLYPTEEGIKLSTAHKLYDTIDIMQTQQDLLRGCTLEEFDAFYKVLDLYLDLLK